MSVTIYPPIPVQRLQNPAIPLGSVTDMSNPVLARLAQLPQLGWHGCTPQMAGTKLRQSFAHIPPAHLIQNVAHAKRWVDEHIISYVNGELPVWLRAPKYVIDAIKVIQFCEQIVATLQFLTALLQQEIALANAWANECTALVAMAQATMTPAGLRTEAETALLPVLNKATQDIAQQINENNASIACLI